MPRGFKVNNTATAIARISLYIEHPDSFISTEKRIVGEWNDEPHTHLVLFGQDDKGVVRAIIFERNREENGGINRCWKCGAEVLEFVQYASTEHYLGEWDHIRNKAGERCDCPENGRVACRSCHRERHVQTQFSKKGGRSNG